MAGDATARSAWATNGEQVLHYLDARPHAVGAAVVVVPGFGEDADDYRPLLEALAPRRALAVDLRGRGRSPHRDDGAYTVERHAGDLRAVIAASGIAAVHLVTYSRGTTYGLAWALGDPGRVASIAIGDYPPAQLVPPPNLAAIAQRRTWRGRPMTERMSVPAITAMVRDAVALEWWEEMGRVDVPLLLLRAGKGAGGMVDDETEARYRNTVPDVRIVTFAGSGHDLWSPDPDRFATTLVAFLAAVDPCTGCGDPPPVDPQQGARP